MRKIEVSVTEYIRFVNYVFTTLFCLIKHILSSTIISLLGNIGLIHDYSGGQANAFNSLFNDENEDDGFDGSSRIVNNEKNLKQNSNIRPPKPR